MTFTDPVSILAQAAGLPADAARFNQGQLATLLDVDVATINRYRRAGQLAGIVTGPKRVIFPREAVAAFLAKLSGQTQAT